MSKSGGIYHFKCPLVDCLEEYIEESKRIFKDRLREHFRSPFLIYYHSQATGHPVDVDYADGITRTIKEAMFICVNDPSLNRNL